MITGFILGSITALVSMFVGLAIGANLKQKEE